MRAGWLALLAILLLPVETEAAGWGWMGVRIRDLSEQEMEEISLRHGIREGYGALIVEVLPDTPAARTGLRTGDLVVTFKDAPVVDSRSLQRLVGGTPAGQEALLTVLRGDEGRRRLRIRVASMPPEVVAARVAAEFGFQMREAPADAGVGAGLASPPTVAIVLKGSRAEQGGLKIGDLIVEINGRPVLSRQAVREALVDTTLDQPLRLAVKREGERVGLTLGPASLRVP
ncbi:MAG: PDZ domain-containing protein [Candidatus Rokubacteria bacterium]|nr:PDZ domain-containing protein [Candidatus Rokubacteria bacterium]